ncbi:MAG: hypothetical protein ABI809_00185 [Caldimonas sp.]
MNPNMVAWRPGEAVADSTLPVPSRSASAMWSRYAGIVGALLAFVLLWGFYTLVQGAVHRAEVGREMARVAIDRKAACSAFSASSARELCAVRLASQGATTPPHPANAMLRAAYRRAAWPSHKAELTAALY